MLRAVNIAWDCEDEEVLETLPDEVDIPDDIDEEDIEDYISDEIGYTFSEYELCEVCFVLPVSK